jgi:hypothetical protein
MDTTTTDRRPRVDWHQLGIELESACVRRGVSLRKAATQMGVPVSGLTRLRQGAKRLSADSLARLMAWLYPRNVPWWVTTGREPDEDEEGTS